LREAKEKSNSDYVIADSEGNPLSESLYQSMWHYVTARSALERRRYYYINGERIISILKPELGQRCKSKKTIYYTLDFKVTPHILRHTYITNLIHEGVDPKTVQYLAGHENSKVTMDIYARVKYNKPWELSKVVNDAFHSASESSKT
jgi:site-specific recombinase XerD